MIHIEQIELFQVSLSTRLPFRYGIAEMRELPHVILRLQARIGNETFVGHSADHLPPHWFSKRAEQTHAEEIEELLGVIRHAIHISEGAKSPSAFDWWLTAYHEQAEWGNSRGLPPLLTHFGATLVERALIDAVCQASGKPFHQVLLGGGLGFDPARVHPELTEFDWPKAFPKTARSRLSLRHTVGLGDPIRREDQLDAPRLNDGLPETLEEAIRAHGLNHFKIKLSGQLERDLEQLNKVHTCLQDNSVGPFVFTLDGNEQYPSTDAFSSVWEEISRCSLLQSPHGQLWCVEQPVHRDTSLDVDPAWASTLQGRPRLIIDESDGTIESLPKALDRGYAGTSHKNCKGVFKGLANGCLLAHRTSMLRASDPTLLMTGEDLCNIGPIALQQDLTVQATLNIPSVERNGHHFFRGLSAFPSSVNESVLKLYPRLFEKHPDGYATLRLSEGKLNLRDLFKRPFGSPETLHLEEFAEPVSLS